MRCNSFTEVDIGDVPSERVLGMKWNVQSDYFEFNVNIASEVLARYENYIQRLSVSNAASGNDLTPP